MTIGGVSSANMPHIPALLDGRLCPGFLCILCFGGWGGGVGARGGWVITFQIGESLGHVFCIALRHRVNDHNFCARWNAVSRFPVHPVSCGVGGGVSFGTRASVTWQHSRLSFVVFLPQFACHRVCRASSTFAGRPRSRAWGSLNPGTLNPKP